LCLTQGYQRKEASLSYIRAVPPEEAAGKLREFYDEDLRVSGYIKNSTQAFSWRPEALAAALDLARAIKSNMDARRYELITVVAAARLRHTC